MPAEWQTAMTSSSTVDDNEQLPPIRIDIPQRFLLLPGAAALTGITIGLFRGSRQASLRFLAENAHRTPRTVRGWYLYNKTKNYRVVLGGLKGAGADATRLGLTAAAWVGVEEGCERTGLGDVREVAAGLVTGTLFGAVCECLLGRKGAQNWDADGGGGGARRPASVDDTSADDAFGGRDRGDAASATVEQGIPPAGRGAGPCRLWWAGRLTRPRPTVGQGEGGTQVGAVHSAHRGSSTGLALESSLFRLRLVPAPGTSPSCAACGGSFQ